MFDRLVAIWMAACCREPPLFRAYLDVKMMVTPKAIACLFVALFTNDTQNGRRGHYCMGGLCYPP